MAVRQPASLRQHGDVVHLTLLGGFELEAGRRTPQLAPHVQRLLAFLALQERPVRRTYVAGHLWLDASQAQAFGSLRTTLWRLRRVDAPVVEATSTHLGVASSVVVDAHELGACAGRILRRSSPVDTNDVDVLAQAHELLPDWYEDWVSPGRERLSQLRLLALESACEELVSAGRYTEATGAAVAAVATDPFRETARRLLIRAYIGTGDYAEAARQFSDFRKRLKRELGLDPSFRMLELARTFPAPASP